MNRLMQDVRYGMRMLAKSPGFAAVAILTLALGIGANTAIFSLIDAVMMRSIPVKDPQTLVVLNWSAHSGPKFHGYSNHGDCGRAPEGEHAGCSFSLPLFKDLRAQTTAFSNLAAFAGPMEFDLSGNGPASIARGELVSGDFFSTLGVSTILGRPLGPADDAPNASAALVLSYGYWQTAFGGERSAVGRTVRINNIPFAIVGVASPSFTNLAPGKTQDFFMPISSLSQLNLPWLTGNRLNDPYAWWTVIVGRLKSGVPVGQAQAAASVIFQNEMVHGAKPMLTAKDDPRISLVPVNEGLSGQRGEISSLLYVMMAAVGAILLIACANVAGLMLARSAARQKEMAVRLALGAGRARVIRQLLTESVMLSLAGGVLGVVLAIWGVHAITVLVTSGSDRPFGFVVAPDWRVLAFTIAVTFITGILFGLAPALRSTRVDLTPALKETASSLPGGGHTHPGRALGKWFRLGDALVVAQVALSILVLVGAGLLVRTLRNLHEVNPGFDTQNVLLFQLDPSLIGYKSEQSAQLYRNLQEQFSALPGVTSASYSGDALLSNSLWTTEVHLDGAPRNKNVSTDEMSVGTAFFSTLRIPMLAGRGFNSADFVSAAKSESVGQTAEHAWEKASVSASADDKKAAAEAAASFAKTAPEAVIVNEAFAKKYFPKGDAVGKHLGGYQSDDYPLGAQDPGDVIIGICGDTKYSDLKRQIKPTMFSPFTGGGANFELRAASNPTALVSAVRSVVAHADKNLPLFRVRTQTEQIEQILSQERIMANISSFFALLALALACIGLYGLLAYEVVRRTREIGIRMALGARPRDVLKIVVRQGIALAIIGAVIGIGAAIGVTRFMAAMLYGVHASDPLTIVAVTALLVAVALAACFIPARRATRVDPMVALRYE
ncbi:MAG TPA: ABC transporter permease [Candidatus Acidoferrales bacterium]|nr:ABC transporter permease [Candidatus Acidoferrales bacterium]